MAQAIKSRAVMPTLDAARRRHTFAEVTLGLEPSSAVAEARRCLNCKAKPCVRGCPPVGVAIPEFLRLIAQGEFAAAEAKIKETNSLPAVCGRVCPRRASAKTLCFKKNGPAHCHRHAGTLCCRLCTPSENRQKPAEGCNRQ